jgi:spore germination cell wall hydrolase CwlJ-like protein
MNLKGAINMNLNSKNVIRLLSKPSESEFLERDTERRGGADTYVREHSIIGSTNQQTDPDEFRTKSIGQNTSTSNDDWSYTEILAQTIYGEARGELSNLCGGLAALIAVGNVVVNRMKNCAQNVAQICQKPMQFSCWNVNDPNLLTMKKAAQNPDSVYLTCREVAEGVLNKNWPDLTNGSTHYYSQHLSVSPFWAKNRRPQVQIGNHLFFKIMD